MSRDLLVEHRLGERGLVRLVVAVSPEAVHVDEHIALPADAEVERELSDHAHRLRVVSVHVEDRGFDHLRHVGAVARRAGILRVGGEADLVVDNKVYGATGPIAGQLRKIEGLRDDSLTGHGGVTVDQERHDAPAVIGIASHPLARARLALDDRVHDLEVGGVRGEAYLHLLAGGRREN